MSLEGMKARIQYYGGAAQKDRMIRDKWKSMLSATKYSYQAALFKKYPNLKKSIPGLFNPITNNTDYDTKMISIGFDTNMKVGQIFLWEDTETYWICYNQDLTELAYFRGKCRRCDYKLNWVDKDRELCETYISVVGPTQPDFRTFNPGYGLSIDTQTADLTVLTSDNEQNRKYFNQNQKFILRGLTYKIHQIDNLSMPGVIQMNCIQDYTNQIEDDIEQNIKNNWNIQPVIPQYPTQYGIEGPTSIKPLFPYEFSALTPGGQWFILENQNRSGKFLLPVKFKDNNMGLRVVIITWENSMSGAFTLCYKTVDDTIFKKHIIVESLM